MIAIASSFGGWFVADNVDPHTRLGYWIVLFIVAFVILCLIAFAGYVRKQWLTDGSKIRNTHSTDVPIREIAKDIETKNNKQPSDPQPNWTIGDAWFYLHEESRWGQDVQDQWTPFQLLDDAAKIGSIRTWGELCTNWDGKDDLYPKNAKNLVFTENEKEIDQSNWQHMKLHVGSILLNRMPRQGMWHITVPGKINDQHFHCYGKIRVNKEQVKKIWPPIFTDQDETP